MVDESFRKSAIGKNGWRNCNLRTTFEKIIRKAGIEPWPKPFVNMRSTRETELNNEFPIHVVAKWLGHSVDIAVNNYLQMTGEHHKKALEYRVPPPISGSGVARNSPTLGASCYTSNFNAQKEVSQKASQSASAGGGKGLKTGENDISAKKQKQAVTSSVCNGLRPVSTGDGIDCFFSKPVVAGEQGFEPQLNGSEPFVLPLHHSPMTR